MFFKHYICQIITYKSNIMDIKSLLEVIKDAAYQVRLGLSAGFLESVYKKALVAELTMRGIKAETEVSCKVYYKGIVVGDYRADIIVDGKVILELKAGRDLTVANSAQLVNYLTSMGLDYGVLINYGEKYRFMVKTRIYGK